jgi:hypothetical protein
VTGRQGYEPTPIENLAPGDLVLVNLPVEATVETVTGTKLIVSHGTTAHVIYTTGPTLWRRPQ